MLSKKMIHNRIFIPLFLLAFSLLLIIPKQSVFADTTDSSEETAKEEYTMDTLETAIDNLNKAAAELLSLISNGDTYITQENEIIYTPQSYGTLKSALENARIELETAKTDLETARNFLAPETNSSNTIDSDKIKELQETLETDFEIVTAAQKSLQNAINELLKRADKTNLNKAIKDADSINADSYTTETYTAFQTCLANAKAVVADENASQTDVDTAKTALDKAIEALVEVGKEYAIIGNTYYYNVTAFGACGTDTLDDTSALQEALDEAGDDIHIVIVIPAGTYYIKKTLYIQSNTTLQLEPGAVIYRSNAGLQYNMLKTSDSSHTCTGYGKYTLAHNITIKGGTWNGGNIAKSKKVCNLFYLGHSDTITIENTTIRNCYGSHAVEFAGVKNATVRNCTFTGFRYGPDKYTSEAIQFDICYKRGSTEWTPGFDMDKTTCKNILVENNTIIDYPRGVGSHHVLKGVPYENVTIRNNTMNRSSSSNQNKCHVGVLLMGTKNVSVTNNTISSYYYGIMIKQSSGLSVKNNTLKYNLSGNLVYEGNKVADKKVRFTITQFKKGTKELIYTCPTVKTGYLKTRGKTYRFKKASKTHKVTLKQKLKKNQKLTFYGKDKYGNTFYKLYTVR